MEEKVNSTCNHYLGLAHIYKVVPNNAQNTQVVISEVNRQGGFWYNHFTSVEKKGYPNKIQIE